MGHRVKQATYLLIFLVLILWLVMHFVPLGNIVVTPAIPGH